jgi:hypothetical protein
MRACDLERRINRLRRERRVEKIANRPNATRDAMLRSLGAEMRHANRSC